MAQEWIEELGRRRRSSKTRRLFDDEEPTNKYSLDATIGPMHYRDAGDEWQDIDTTLVPSTRSIVGFGNPAFEMAENEYEMFILGTLNSGVPLVRYLSKNTEYWVQFAAHNLQWTNDLDQIEFIATPVSTPTEVSGSEAKWPDAYGVGLDLRYIAGMGRMGKWLDIAAALPAPPQFIIDGGNPVIEFAEILEFHGDLEVYVNGEEWNKRDDVSAATEIEFRSPDGEIQFVIPVAAGYDEGGGVTVGQLRLKTQGNKLYVTARFPWAWLQSAAYPVHLDTTVDKQVAAGADDGRMSSAWGFSAEDSEVRLGYEVTLGSLHSHAVARWTGVTIGGTIDANTYINCYVNAIGAGTPELKVYGVDEDNPAAPTSAAEFNADPLTTASVDWDGAWPTAGIRQQSPSLATIFQELADTYTISNDAVMVQIKNDHGVTGGDEFNHMRTWEWSWEIGGLGPQLHIEYVSGALLMMHYMRMRKE